MTDEKEPTSLPNPLEPSDEDPWPDVKNDFPDEPVPADATDTEDPVDPD